MITMDKRKTGWTKKWGSDDFTPDWELKSFPESINELIEDGLLPNGATVLDIGCGSGYLAAKLAEKAYQVTAFDFAQTAIENAQENYTESNNLKYYVADATLPFPFSDTFKIGIDRGTLHTLPLGSHTDYAQNISQVIEEGGLLIILFGEKNTRKLFDSWKDDIQHVLKVHVVKLFEKTFEAVRFENIMIDSHVNHDFPGFLIILKRNGVKI